MAMARQLRAMRRIAQTSPLIRITPRCVRHEFPELPKDFDANEFLEGCQHAFEATCGALQSFEDTKDSSVLEPLLTSNFLTFVSRGSKLFSMQMFVQRVDSDLPQALDYLSLVEASKTDEGLRCVVHFAFDYETLSSLRAPLPIINPPMISRWVFICDKEGTWRVDWIGNKPPIQETPTLFPSGPAAVLNGKVDPMQALFTLSALGLLLLVIVRRLNNEPDGRSEYVYEERPQRRQSPRPRTRQTKDAAKVEGSEDDY
eukprot:TRINITY_DN3343_c0_g1_i1.p1 TRINITY_DN3343_c0_g1~~TRINITY_DN3343_c0_g1_i1.p1  ORF type:complete len:258 (+),score=35.21 TRINITY_DN3343_c0_g1_i1:77-850(+)